MMRTEVQETLRLRPEDLIDHLREGKEDAREILIKTYWEYIVSSAARMTGRRSDSSDEFSVALSAFNEAIDSYDRSKSPSFLSFAGLVINRRLIGYFRKTQKYQSEYVFSSLSQEAEDAAPDISDPGIPLSEAFEIQEELLAFRQTLGEYGITLDMLLHSAPKHADTRALCTKIAQTLHENDALSGMLLHEKRLPLQQLLGSFSLSRKTIEKNRKYIIALFLVLNSELDILKGYIRASGQSSRTPRAIAEGGKVQ